MGYGTVKGLILTVEETIIEKAYEILKRCGYRPKRTVRA